MVTKSQPSPHRALDRLKAKRKKAEEARSKQNTKEIWKKKNSSKKMIIFEDSLALEGPSLEEEESKNGKSKSQADDLDVDKEVAPKIVNRISNPKKDVDGDGNNVRILLGTPPKSPCQSEVEPKKINVRIAPKLLPPMDPTSPHLVVNIPIERSVGRASISM